MTEMSRRKTNPGCKLCVSYLYNVCN